MNTNPTLMIGLAMEAARKKGLDIQRGDESQAELRVYPPTGAGWYFVLANSPGRWYWKDQAGADHFNRAEQSDVDAIIAQGARVQLTGYHSRSLILWPTWQAFENEVK